MRRAQELPYVPDDGGNVDLVETDLDTVTREGGDCEEKAMWLAAHLAAYGYQAIVSWIPQAQYGAPLDHVSTEVKVRRRWLWADGTVPGARLGERPEDAARRVGESGARWGISGAPSAP